MKKVQSAVLAQTLVVALATWGVGSSFGCAQKTDTVEQTTDTTTRSADGTTHTKQDTKQVGETVESKVKTSSDSPAGSVNSSSETYIGTVTAYEPGKRIEVMTGEKKTHSFELDQKGLVSEVGNDVTIGSRVKLVEEKGDGQRHRISVQPA